MPVHAVRVNGAARRSAALQVAVSAVAQKRANKILNSGEWDFPSQALVPLEGLNAKPRLGNAPRQ